MHDIAFNNLWLVGYTPKPYFFGGGLGYYCGGPLFVGPLFGRTCWTCLNPPVQWTITIAAKIIIILYFQW